MSGLRLGGMAFVPVSPGFPWTAYSLLDFAYVGEADYPNNAIEVSDKTVNTFDEPNNVLVSPNGLWLVTDANFPPAAPNSEGEIFVMSSSAVTGTPAPFVVSAADAAGGWALHPSWHPDSDQIVYVRGRAGFQGDVLLTSRTNPGVETAIYTNPDPSGATGWGVYRPQFNRDATKIAWIRDKNAAPTDGGDGLWVADADGSNLTQIDDFGGSLHGYLFDGDQFCWDPSSDVIYYVRYEGNGATEQQLYKINADGTGLTQLSTDGTTSLHPCRINRRSLAPDGSFLIGTSQTSVDFANSFDVYRWELDGSGGTLLGTLAADGHSLGTNQNFRNVYVHDDGRVYYIYGQTQGQLASFLPDGSDWRLDVDLGVNADGDQFYTGTGIQWI